MTRRLAAIRSTAASASTTGASNRATATTSSNDNGPAPTVTAEGTVPAGTGAVCVCVMPLHCSADRRCRGHAHPELCLVCETGTCQTGRRADRHHHCRLARGRRALHRLARRLNDAGHTAVIATHEPFRALVEAHGIEFAGLAADPREILGTEQGRRWQAAQGLTSAVRMVGLMRPYAREMAEKTLAATEGADLILCSTLTAPNYHIAQGRGIPSMGVFLQPLERTREFSSVLTGGVRSYGSWGNRWSAAVSEALLAVPFMGEVNQARTGMGLPAISYRQLRRDLAEQRWPVQHGFSRHPSRGRPTGARLEVVGYWWPDPDPPDPLGRPRRLPGRRRPAGATGRFGSMAAGTGDAKRLAEVAVTALRDVGVRGSSRPAGRAWPLRATPTATSSASARRRMTGSYPGSPRSSITAAPAPSRPRSTTAYRPSRCPCSRTSRSGRSGCTVRAPPRSRSPISRLTADRLAFALRQVLYVPSYRAKAVALAAKVAEEDGAGAVVEAVARL